MVCAWNGGGLRTPSTRMGECVHYTYLSYMIEVNCHATAHHTFGNLPARLWLHGSISGFWHTYGGLRETRTDLIYRLYDSILVHSDSVRLTHGTRTANRDPMSNGSCEITFKAVDYATHHFGVADECVASTD
jgi:hypothetical protein